MGKCKLDTNDTKNAQIILEDGLKIIIEKIKVMNEELLLLVELTNNTGNGAVKSSLNELNICLEHGATTYCLLGELHSEQIDYVRAQFSYMKALQMRILRDGHDNKRTIEVKQKVALVYIRLGKYREAVNLYTNLLKAAKSKNVQGVSDEIANALLNLGRAFQAYGKQGESINYFEKSIQMKSDIFGEEHEEVKNAKADLNASLFCVLVESGNSYKNEGNELEAVKAFEQAVKMIEKLPNTYDQIAVSALLDSLADLYYSSELCHMRIEYVVELYKRSFNLLRKNCGPDSSEATAASIKLGQALLRGEKFQEALSTLKISLNNIQNKNGKRNSSYAEVKHYIGEAFIGIREYENAMSELIEAAELREDLFGLSNPFYLDTVELIGKVNQKLGNYESALYVFDDCLDKRQDLLQKKRAECATLFVDIDKHREKYTTTQDEFLACSSAVANVHHAIGLLNMNLNKLDRAFENFNSEIELLKCHLSEGDLKLAFANEMIGVIYFIWGEQNKAMKLFRSALNAKRLTLGWRHVEYANTLIHVANVHRSQKNYVEAIRLYEEAGSIKLGKSRSYHTGLYKIYETIGDMYMEELDNEKATNSYEKARGKYCV